MTDINDISEVLKSTREMSGLTLDEVSKDLEIPVLSLEQIEDGNIGAFKDIFVLKDYLESYAKYLGIDYEDVIDEFNEYMFEKTSKIPMEEIEKAVKEKEKEESESNRIASPYTKAAPIKSNKQFIFMLILITVLVIIAIIWSIKQITVGSTGANIAGYFNK
ncbi:MAG: helix-turn-helix domain-containing protein [Bacilli bacterium]|nr:helix-turn-helix domain-containing protein [Bacilli bacterium]